VKLPEFISKLRSKKASLQDQRSDDFLKVMSSNPEYFAQLEYAINDKPVDEILKEIQTGWDLLDIKMVEVFDNSNILLIPPKYELWTYLFLCINFAISGYKITFAYHAWSDKLIDTVKKHLNYLQYQNIKFAPLEKLDAKTLENNKILNLSDNFTKSPKLPSFSTVIVTKDSDLDYVVAYILSNAFSFAGIKISNVKRVLIDEDMREAFESKLKSRIESIGETNKTTIRSKQTRQELHQLVCEAISDGADIFWGNPNIDALGSLNLILTNTSKSMRIFQKKFFGPVLLLSYISINSKVLRDALKQQPSKGVIVFTQSSRFLDLNALALRDYEVLKRPSDFVQNLAFEDNPNLEFLFKELYGEGKSKN
jgi:hypothetical protein